MPPSFAARMGALMFVACATAAAQEDPAAVYDRLHRAALAGNADEAIGYATAAQRARLAGKPRAEREAIVQAMAATMPRVYAYSATVLSGDGNSARVRATGTGGPANGPMALNADFLKQEGAWKVESWEWSSDAAAVAPAPAAPVMAAAPAPVSYDPKVPQVVNRAPHRRVHNDRDARACLNLPTTTAIVRCAEKFR